MKKTLLALMATALIVCCTACSGGNGATYKGETHCLGETVSTNLIEFTLDRADLAIALNNVIDKNYSLPKEYDPADDNDNPFVAAKGTTFLPFTYTVKNLDRATLSFYIADSSGEELKIFCNDKKHVIGGFDTYEKFKQCLKIDADGGYDEYNASNVLVRAGETTTVRAYAIISDDITDLNSDFTIVFTLPDVNNTFVEFAYAVTAADRESVIAKELAAEEERKRKEAEELAFELAEIDSALANKIKQNVVGEWEYTDGNKIHYIINFRANNTVTVKTSLNGQALLNNEGTYSVRNKVILVEYSNGGKAKCPYNYNNGEFEMFPLIGIPKNN